MTRKFMLAAIIPAFLTGSVLFTSCSDDDDKDYRKRTIKFENVTETKDFVQSGIFKREGNDPMIHPGQEVSFSFYAAKGQAFSFATMWGNSKDIFFAPENPGISLFDANGTPISNGTAQVKIWDNGTIRNTDPQLVAANQPTVAENNRISEIAGTDNMGFTFPAANQMMDIRFTYEARTSEFTVTIKNISNRTNVPTAFSPGVWAVSNVLDGDLVNEAPFYEKNHTTSTALTALATSGNTEPFSNIIENGTGIITGLSPVLVVLYTGDENPIFKVGEVDRGLGLKNLAQTGDASVLKAALERERNVKSVVILGTSPLAPGASLQKEYDIYPEDKIAFATMFSYSNDWFYSNNSAILPYNTGDKTSQVSLYDNGTAFSQYPGAGNAQSAFNGTPIVENQAIKIVNLETYPDYPVPTVNKIIKVTVW